jgi:hypothetical protein
MTSVVSTMYVLQLHFQSIAMPRMHAQLVDIAPRTARPGRKLLQADRRSPALAQPSAVR